MSGGSGCNELVNQPLAGEYYRGGSAALGWGLSAGGRGCWTAVRGSALGSARARHGARPWAAAVDATQVLLAAEVDFRELGEPGAIWAEQQPACPPDEHCLQALVAELVWRSDAP